MKRKEINWSHIQKDIDLGMTWKEIRISYGLCSATIAKARKNGMVKFRDSSAAQTLAWKVGKQDPAVFRTLEHRKIMSKLGGYRPRAGRCKKFLYLKKDGTKVWLQGTWEVKLADFLESKNLNWDKNRVGYKYSFEEKDHLYFPDFWLKDLDVYVEVKGYETEKDKSKWNQFPFQLFVVRKQEIQNLDSWWKEQF